MSDRDLYIRASEAYNKGIPIMSNVEFDALERQLREQGHLDLINKTHDEIAGSDIDDLTFSILPLESWNDIISWIRLSKQTRFLLSLKIDGVLGKLSWTNKFKAQSRGRSTKYPWDYTEALGHIIPSGISNKLVTGEVYVPAKFLEYFKDKYGRDKFAVPRSAAISLLRTPCNYEDEDLKKLILLAYSTDEHFSSRKEMYDNLQSLGFDVPPHSILNVDSEWTDDELQSNVREFMKQLESYDEIPSDGVVMEFDNLDIVPEVEGKYRSTQIALKVDRWGTDIFKGVVNGLKLTPGKGNYGTVLTIEPVKMPDGIVQRNINAFNPGIVLRAGITKGSEIKFKRKANQMCVLIYGDENEEAGDANDL